MASRNPIAPAALSILLSLLAFSVGCGNGGPVQVQPTFLLDGKPLADASVSFIRNDGKPGRPAYGATDAQGVATMTTSSPNDGVMPGPYAVVVMRAPADFGALTADDQDLTDPKVLAKLSSGGGDVAQPRRKRVLTTLPEVYSDPGRTPLKCVVTRDGEELTFNLDSKP